MSTVIATIEHKSHRLGVTCRARVARDGDIDARFIVILPSVIYDLSYRGMTVEELHTMAITLGVTFTISCDVPTYVHCVCFGGRRRRVRWSAAAPVVFARVLERGVKHVIAMRRPPRAKLRRIIARICKADDNFSGKLARLRHLKTRHCWLEPVVPDIVRRLHAAHVISCAARHHLWKPTSKLVEKMLAKLRAQVGSYISGLGGG
jgi:hypothetical protein